MTLAQQQAEQLSRAISAAPVKPFLVTADPLGTRLIIHIAREAAKSSFSATIGFSHRVRRDFSDRLSTIGLDLPIRIKLYGRSGLDRARSLESLVAKFCSGERLYDPTSVFDEAEELVAFAGHLRRRLGSDLRCTYWNARWRTTYVLLNGDAFVGPGRYGLRREKLTAAERAVVAAHDASVRSDVSRNVRLCFDAPGMQSLVPVDEASFAYGLAQEKRIPTVLRLATLAKVPVLGALLGIGSAGMTVAKLPPIESRPTLTSANIAMAAATVEAKGLFRNTNSAVHADWSQGGAGRNPSIDQTVPAAIGSQGSLSRDHVIEVSRSGATFDASLGQLHERRLDLRWVHDSGPSAPPARPGSRAFPAMQPGIAGILGLSRLTESDLSDESYGAVLMDMLPYFGLPPSLQAETLLHIANLVDSVRASGQNGRFFDRKVLAQGESYWEWLRRMGPRDQNPSPNGPAQGPGRTSPRLNCSSC